MRKVLIAAHETGTIRDIVMVPMVVSPALHNQTMLAVNPLGQIPTLALDDGRILYDSTVICRYLDCVLGEGRLHPRDPFAEVETMRRSALGDGFAAMCMSLIGEKSRGQPDHSEQRMAVIGHKLPRIFAALEQDAAATAGGPFDMGQIATVAALSYLDFRLPQKSIWRHDYPVLANWFEEAGTRSSVTATFYLDDLAGAPHPGFQTPGQSI